MQREDHVEALFLSTQTMIRAWKSYFQKVLEPENISLMQMGVLFYLSNNPAANGREISAALHLSPSAVAQLIDGLDVHGYITRENAAEDRRITHFGLSEIGQAKVRSLEEKRRRIFNRLTSELTDEEMQMMAELQQKITRQVTNHTPNEGE